MKTIPTFKNESHIGRKNCETFARNNSYGPEFGWSYKLKKKIERFQIRYRDNQAFRDLIDASLAVIFLFLTFVAVFTVSLYLAG